MYNRYGYGFPQNLFKGGSVPFEQGYIDILYYAITQGYTIPNGTHQAAQNTLYKWIKDNIGWSNFYDFTVCNRGSKEFAIVNWANTTKNSTRVNNPTWTDGQGFSTNGTNSYVESAIREIDITVNANTYGLVLYSSYLFAMGYNRQGNNQDKWISHDSSTGVSGRQKNVLQDAFNIVIGSKYRAITRISATTYEAYVDTKQSQLRNTVGTLTAAPFVVGANANAANGGSYVATPFTIKFVAKVLSEAQHLGLETAIETYITASS